MKKQITFFILLVFIGFSGLTAQVNQDRAQLPGITPVYPDYTGIPSNQPSYVPNVTKLPGHYSRSDWKAAIDAAWGVGLPTADKLAIFDNFWNAIDQKFACFHNNNIDWNALKTLYRPEIQAGVSRGRFQAIMNYISLALKEPHTNARDNLISATVIAPGVPILNIGGSGKSGRFGAGLTPLPDSSLLVYDVIPNHPMGLQRGDIVLGYDRIPWKVLIFQLLSYQLPIRGYPGSSPTSYIHSLLAGAGKNWNLFDTIDFVKYSTCDTLHLPTSLLLNQELDIYISEQVEIPGIPKPDPYNGIEVSYGIYPGTNIGYIYGAQWGTPSKAQLFNAVHNLLQLQPDGLIFDYRTNFGGGMGQGDSAFKLLYPNSVTYTDYGYRTNVRKHTQMTPANMSSYYTIPGTPPGYNKPIAVLTGPGAVSAGDQVALRMKYHPRVRTFGKSTNGAFNGPIVINLNPDWYARYAQVDFYELKNPGIYLTHVEFPVDEKVWLTPAMVAQGKDDVVEAALEWINFSNSPGITLFEDNAENGFGNWTTNQGWNTITKYPHSPVNSFTDSPFGNYANNANNSMTLKNSLNVSSYSVLTLSFWHRYNTQTSKDYCRVEVSSNNGTSWQEVKNYSGDLNTLTQVEVDITNYANKTANLKIRFRLTSDKKTVADGWYVDDIKISGKTTGKNFADNQENNNNPKEYSLGQNYPNPFNPVTKISFDIAKQGFISLKIFDALGREVRTLVNEVKAPGSYAIDFDGTNLPSGIYFYKLQTENYSGTKKMLLIK
jgi:hypothetical protein